MHERFGRREALELVLLGAIWGSSFLFMRVAAPEFGPLALIEVRVAIAALLLALVAAARGELGTLRAHALPLTVLGALNSAIPFCLFAYATLTLPAGYSSVLNATTPLFGAFVGVLFLHEALGARRGLGLCVGFAGVVLLVSGKLRAGADHTAIGAGLLAGLLYAISAHYTKRRLAGASPLAISAGSQIAAAALLLPFAVWQWPRELPSAAAWGCALTLGAVCTALAYIVFFHLLRRAGTTRSMTVTYLVPVFGALWGFMWLDEPVTLTLLCGGAVILLGVLIVNRAPSPEPTAPTPEPCPNPPPR